MSSYKVATVVDFIAKSETTDTWRMVLVEDGPWSEIDVELTRLQNRLYDCVDAALDGQLSQKFPETLGKNILIQLDGYNLPEEKISQFFNAFANNVMLIDDYANALERNEYVKAISFQLNLEKNKPK